MKKCVFYITAVMCFILFFNENSSSQNVSPYTISSDWYFGRGGRLKFPDGKFPSGASPTVLYNAANVDASNLEASTSLTFPDGNVALYSNAKYVYNGNALTPTDVIRNLATDNTCATSSAGANVAFPDPASPSNAFYYIVGNDITGGNCPDGGINMYRFSGTGGGVTYVNGPTLLYTNGGVNEAIAAGSDGDGGYWLACHDKTNSNIFRLWHFTASGITGPINQDLIDLGNTANLQSYIKFSPCMDKIAFIGGQSVIVYAFDRSTGTIGSELRRKDGILTGYSGLEFSPDGNTIYYSRWGYIVSFIDINTGTNGTITGSQSWSMQLGADGKIYTSPDNSTSIGYIQNSNNPASASYHTLPLAGTANVVYGLINLSWLNPGSATLQSHLGSDCITYNFSIDFKNYFNEQITINPTSIEYSINGAAWTTLPGNTYSSPGGVSYTIKARFKDTHCAQNWYTNEITINPSCPVPVLYLHYSAHRIDKTTAHIHWSTSQEKDCANFILERSTDGINYIFVGTIAGHGNSSATQQYNFTDYNAPSGFIYYRLIQVDFSGRKNTPVYMPVNEYDDDQVIVYPNPFKDKFNVVVYNAKDMKLNVTDVVGHLFSSVDITEDVFEFTLGETLPPGTYFISIQGTLGIVHKKMVKKE